MIELNTNQVLRVEHLLVEKGISSNQLLTDLIDHVCCAIEKKLEYGREFDVALTEVLNDFGENGLLEIQNETTYLTNQNLQIMRQITYNSGLVAMGLILVGSFFKVMHWPGASIMFVLGYTFLCLLFLPLFFIDKSKIEISGVGKIAQVFGFLGSASVLSGILFKVMHWPGANMIAISGLMTLCFVYLPLMLYKNRLDKASPENNRYLILGFSMFFGTVFLMISLRPSQTVKVAPRHIEVSIGASQQLLNESIELNSADTIQEIVARKEKVKALCANQLEWLAKIKYQIIESANNEKPVAIGYDHIENPEKIGEDSNSAVWSYDGVNYQDKMRAFQKELEELSSTKFEALAGENELWLAETVNRMPVGVGYLFVEAQEIQVLSMEIKALQSIQ